ncbi:MAG: DNA-processing protein DprA, partial [Roseobacter sp.]
IGNAELLKTQMISIVGARNASSLGTRMARKLARDLGASGYTVVSGLARGVDAAAHDAALSAGTLAVLAGGVDTVYPAENADLCRTIADQGLLVSEQPMGLQPVARHFPCRNRIISGLSRATVIVEAAAKSGSLITARDALDQGRDVLAVPGNPFDARAAGCNQLIREGATLVRSAQDVIEALAPLHGDAPELPFAKDQPGPVEPANKKRKKALSEVAALHRQILSRLSPAPVAEDQLIRDLAVPASEAAPALLDLELDGRIRRQSGGMISRE